MSNTLVAQREGQKIDVVFVILFITCRYDIAYDTTGSNNPYTTPSSGGVDGLVKEHDGTAPAYFLNIGATDISNVTVRHIYFLVPLMGFLIVLCVYFCAILFVRLLMTGTRV